MDANIRIGRCFYDRALVKEFRQGFQFDYPKGDNQMNRMVRWFKDVQLKTDYFPFDLRNDHMELLDADYTVWDEKDIEKVQDLVVQFANGRPSWIPWVSYSGLFDGEIIPSYRMIEICKRILDSGLAEKKNVVDKIEFIKNKSHLGYRFAFEG